MSRRPIHVFDPVFRQNYYFFHKWKRDHVLEWARRAGTDAPEDFYAEGFCFRSDKGIGIWVEASIHTTAGLSDLVHELQHATMWTLIPRGVTPTAEEDEPFAYHIGFLLKEILSRAK